MSSTANTEGSSEPDENALIAAMGKRKKTHKKQLAIACPKCKVILNSKAAFKYHTKNDVCTRKRKRKMLLGAYREDNGGTDNGSSVVGGQTGKKELFRCPDCENTFKSSKGLQYHIQRAVCARRKERSAGFAGVPTNRSRGDGAASSVLPSGVNKLPESNTAGPAQGTPDMPHHPSEKPNSKSAQSTNLPTPSPNSLTCPTCNKELGSVNALKYHTAKRVCHKRNVNGAKPDRMFNIDLSGAPSQVRLSGHPSHHYGRPGTPWSHVSVRMVPGCSQEVVKDLRTHGMLFHTKLPEDIQQLYSFTNYQAEAGSVWKYTTKEYSVRDNVDGEEPNPLKLLSSVNISPKTLTTVTDDADTFLPPDSPGTEILLHAGNRVNAIAFHPGVLKDETGTDSGVKSIDATFMAVGTHTTLHTYHVKGKDYRAPNYIQVWRVDKGNKRIAGKSKCVLLIEHCGDAVLCLEWCPLPCVESSKSLGMLACALADGFVGVIEVPNVGEVAAGPVVIPLQKLAVASTSLRDRGKGATPSSLAWHPKTDELLLACGLDDGCVSVMDCSGLRLGRGPATWECPTVTLMPPSRPQYYHILNERNASANSAVLDIAWSPESPNLLVASNQDSMVMVWDTRRPVAPLALVVKRVSAKGTEYATPMTSVSWMEKSDVLLLGDESGVLTFLELRNGAQHSFHFHTGAIRRIAANTECPGLFATCSDDGEAKFHISRTIFSGDLVDGEVQETLGGGTHFGTSRSGATQVQNGRSAVGDCLLVSTQDNAPEVLIRNGIRNSGETNIWSGLRIDGENTKGLNEREVGKYEVQSLTCIAWGNGNNGQNSWVAWGGENGLVRVSTTGPIPHTQVAASGPVGVEEEPVKHTENVQAVQL